MKRYGAGCKPAPAKNVTEQVCFPRSHVSIDGQNVTDGVANPVQHKAYTRMARAHNSSKINFGLRMPRLMLIKQMQGGIDRDPTISVVVAQTPFLLTSVILPSIFK